ncbi:MAG: hypothetical protein K5656_12525 [Lachnospiraceae bacterium]|nr:hypothetical protein [Lachnospiraceae bacterium]
MKEIESNDSRNSVNSIIYDNANSNSNSINTDSAIDDGINVNFDDINTSSKKSSKKVMDNDSNIVNAVTANLIIRDYLKNIVKNRYDYLNKNEKDFKYNSAIEYKKSLKNAYESLNDKNSKFSDVEKLLKTLSNNARIFETDLDTADEAYRGPKTVASADASELQEELELIRINLMKSRNNIYRAVNENAKECYYASYNELSILRDKEKKVDTSYANYNYDYMRREAYYLSAIEKKLRRVSSQTVKNYDNLFSKDDYLHKLKKDDPNAEISVMDQAKEYVVMNYLEKAYNLPDGFGKSEDGEKYLIRLNKTIDDSEVKKEIHRLSKNQKFIELVNNNKDNAFAEWDKLENKCAEYLETYRLMGGLEEDGIDLLVEQAMADRMMLLDRVNEEIAKADSEQEIDLENATIKDIDDRGKAVFADKMADNLLGKKDFTDATKKAFDAILADNDNNVQDAFREFSMLSASIYDKASNILALQILSNPKNKTFATELAADNLANPDKGFKDLAKVCRSYLENKKAFEYDFDEKGTKKCEDTLKKLFKDGKIKDNLIASYKEKKAASRENSMIKTSSRSKVNVENATKNALKKFKQGEANKL